MKRTIKIYLEPEDEKELKKKAERLGFIGRGYLTRFVEKMAREPTIFLDENAKMMLRTLDLKQAYNSPIWLNILFTLIFL